MTFNVGLIPPGPEALVKPILQAIASAPIEESPNRLSHLIHELCDVTANLESDSPLIERFLLPEANRLTSVFSFPSTPPKINEAVASYIACLANLTGIPQSNNDAKKICDDESQNIY